MSRRLKSIDLDALRQLIEESGFRRVGQRGAETFRRRLDDDVSVWLGLTTARRYEKETGEITVRPNVGVIFHEVAALANRLRNIDVPDVSTISWPLARVTPSEIPTSWPLRSNQRTGAPEEVMEAILTHGLPSAQQTRSLAALIEALRAGTILPHQTPYGLPVALLLDGRTDEATDAVAEFVDELGGRDDQAAEDYREFAGRLNRHIADSQDG